MTIALILGAAVWPDGPSPTLARRVGHAVVLWQTGAVSRLIPCGGLGRHPPTEAEMMRQILTQAGVPDAAITLEDRSTTTLENIAFAIELMRAEGWDRAPVLIVTDATHAPRAVMTARALGLDARANTPPLWQGRPRLLLRSAARECLALPGYWLRLRRHRIKRRRAD